MYFVRSSLVAAALLATAPAAAGAAMLSASDRSFVEQAMTDNTAQIRQGQVFADSSDRLIQSFAKRMVTDHSEANTQLIALADSDGIHVTNGQSPDLPQAVTTHEPELSAQQKDKIMAGLTPTAFFTQQVRDHQQAIALYKREIATGKNAQVVAYANHALPVLESHLRLAEQDLRQEKDGHHG